MNNRSNRFSSGTAWLGPALSGLLLLVLVALMLLPTGTADAAESPLTMNMNEFDFGRMNVGGESVEQAEFVVTNNGEEAVTFDWATIDPELFIFPVIFDLCRFEVLEQGESCMIIVQFNPADPGDFTARFEVHSSAPGTDPSADLHGFAYPRLLPDVKITPQAIDFGTWGIGATTAKRRITVEDSGQGDLDVRAARLTGPEAGDFTIVRDQCKDRVLASGMTCDIEIEFSPFEIGQRNATLFIPTNVDTDTTVTLTGAGRGFVPSPPGNATVKLAEKLPKAKGGNLLIPFTCETELMETCSGKLRAFATGEALKNGKGGDFMVARGTFAARPGKRFAKVVLEPRAVRALTKRGRFPASFEVSVVQGSGATSVRTVKRSIRG